MSMGNVCWIVKSCSHCEVLGCVCLLDFFCVSGCWGLCISLGLRKLIWYFIKLKTTKMKYMVWMGAVKYWWNMSKWKLFIKLNYIVIIFQKHHLLSNISCIQELQKRLEFYFIILNIYKLFWKLIWLFHYILWIFKVRWTCEICNWIILLS